MKEAKYMIDMEIVTMKKNKIGTCPATLIELKIGIHLL